MPVNIGSVTDLNLTLRLGTIEESVTVSGESRLIERSKTALSSVITQDTIESLPSRNRQYLDFALLLPASTESVTRIQGTGAVVGGARSKEGSLLVDGFYNLDETFAMPKTHHSQDAIQEFQVVTFGGAAEYGRAIGGVINAVTKSGGNKVQGSGYGFFRNKNLNEQDFAEKRLGRPKSDFSRQQWGGNTVEQNLRISQICRDTAVGVELQAFRLIRANSRAAHIDCLTGGNRAVLTAGAAHYIRNSRFRLFPATPPAHLDV